MSGLLMFVRLVALACLTGWALFSGWRLASGQKDVVWFAIVGHFILTGCPILWDLVFGIPTYSTFPGYRVAAEDQAVLILYCVYVCWLPAALYLFGRRQSQPGEAVPGIRTAEMIDRAEIILFWGLLVSPVLVVFLSPDPRAYVAYGSAVTAGFTENVQFHGYVTATCLAAIVSGISILVVRPRVNLRTILVVTPWIAFACWVFGKRTVLALVVLGVIYLVHHRGITRGFRFAFLAAAGVLAVASASYLYQLQIRGIDLRDRDAYYDNVRVDFGRDSGLKQAIYAELSGPSYAILDYRGQSFLFNLVMPIPREWWPDKPWPIAVYQTSRALGLPQVKDIGWGVTTSWHEEAVANFGWFGFIFAPIVLAFICRIGDREDDPVGCYLTLCIVAFLLSLQAAAFWPVIAIYLIHRVFLYLRKPRALRRVQQQRSPLTDGARLTREPWMRA